MFTESVLYRIVNIHNSSFIGNYAKSYGGATLIYIATDVDFHNYTFINCHFRNNTSQRTGVLDIWFYGINGYVWLINSTFINNILPFIDSAAIDAWLVEGCQLYTENCLF